MLPGLGRFKRFAPFPLPRDAPHADAVLSPTRKRPTKRKGHCGESAKCALILSNFGVD